MEADHLESFMYTFIEKIVKKKTYIKKGKYNPIYFFSGVYVCVCAFQLILFSSSIWFST